jgi:hypothetical protein
MPDALLVKRLLKAVIHAPTAVDQRAGPVAAEHPFRNGATKGLNASFNLAELLEPFERQFVLQQFSPETWLRKAKRLRRDWESLAESIPRGFNDLLEQLESGGLAVHIKHPPLETSVNRLVYGLCTSALLLASALLWIHEVPPTIHGVSILGAAGYLVAAFLATRVLWLIHWEKRQED